MKLNIACFPPKTSLTDRRLLLALVQASGATVNVPSSEGTFADGAEV